MKLELKHLALYLPYELKYQNPKSGTISVMTVPDLNMIIKCQEKPILRPLSDLTKRLGDYDGNMLGWSFYNSERECYMAIVNKEISVAFLELLLEWHFDVFELIEKDLAIDYYKKPVEDYCMPDDINSKEEHEEYLRVIGLNQGN